MSKILKENWLGVWGWLFFATALATLAYPAFTSCNFPGAANVGVAGALVAMGVQFFVHNKNIADKREQRSCRHLDACVLLYKEASEILQDGTDDPKQWIRAALILLGAGDLKKQVKEKSHRRVLDARLRKYESIFHNVLKRKHRLFWWKAVTFSRVPDPDDPNEIYGQSRMVPKNPPMHKPVKVVRRQTDAGPVDSVPQVLDEVEEVRGVPAQAVYVVCVAAKWIDDSGNRSTLLKDQIFSDGELEKIGLPRDMRRTQ
ncbi:MAG: hypothetical protein OD918_10445 [Gammaproteobacteria bacterium]